MITKYNKKGSITKINENKLIKNKFKSIPETSAEIIDCQQTLTRKELKELQYGPLIMDLGKICIHSETIKNFSIVNTLKKTILVQVKISSENEHNKIIKSNPLSQVIPSQRMAGFDIIFNAKNIGIFEDNIILLINGIHTISFTLKAEIISMDLKLSNNKLLFEFPIIDYLDFNIVKSITLTNILSAPTKYKFDINSINNNNNEITIKPNNGIIKPNKSETIQFMWSPQTLRPNNKSTENDNIKLQIIDGFDKIIHLQTILPLSKCILTNNSINFGIIGIGTEQTKRIHIKNIGHIQSIFRIIHCPKHLSIYPLYGKVDIGTSQSLSITYLSLNPESFNEHIIIEIRGGKTLKLSVFAQSIIPKINIKQNEFNFNGVTIGDKKELPIEINNVSSVNAYLFLDMSANEIYPNGTFDITFPNEWSDLATEPNKAPIIVLPPIDDDELHTFIPPPKIITNQSSKKSVGNVSRKSSRRSLTMKSSRKGLLNTPSNIPSDYICIVRSLDNPNLNKQDSIPKIDTTKVLPINKSKKVLNSPMMRRGSLLAMGQHLTMMKDFEESEQTQSSECKNNNKIDIDDNQNDNSRYRILIKSNSTLKFKLIFNPKEINQYDFDLNIIMAGVSIENENCLVLRKCIFGNGLKPRIALSTRNISFFDVTVLNEIKAKQQPYEKSIIITNEENNKIEWKCKIKDNMHHKYSNCMNNLTWKIIPDCGILEPLKTNKISIYFSPITDELFRDNIDLLIDNNIYLSIGLEGQASYPKLSFNQEFLLLPTVPLNCKSSKIVLIKNHGYENLEIKYEIIDDKAASFINLRFPNGRIIGGNGPNELKVEISLLSNINVSFTTRIDFLDIDCNRFSIFIAGMTDNCILTNQPFLCNNDYSIGVNNNNNNIVVPKLKVLNNKKKITLIGTGIPDDIPTNILCDVSVLIRYLEANSYLKFDADIDSFPSDLVQSNGEMIFDLVQFLSGKKIPGIKHSNRRSKINTNRSHNNNTNQSHIERLIHNYAQLINFLKAHGALITIRPEYCLSCTEYIKFIQISSNMNSNPPSSNNNKQQQKFNELKSSKAQADTQKLKKQSERIHPMLSYVCWTQLLFQIIKLFILNKITFPNFIKQSYINELIENEDSFILKYISSSTSNNDEENDNDDDDYKLNEEKLIKSNIYSMQENILLLWISIHYCKISSENGGTKQFFENFSSLSDGIAISYLLKSYAPHISELNKINIRTPLNESDKNMNALIIIQSMKKLGLNIAINCNDITNPIERNICLLILYLYQHLPDYKLNNKQNIITFDGNLNEEIIRKIHIKNPSKISKICYEIILDGDQQFELKNSSFIVLAPQANNKKKKKKINNNNNATRLSTARTEKTDSILLEPETDIIISYKPRFIRPSNARLSLLSKPFPDAIFPCKVPGIMTFELKSEMIASKPIKIIECKGKLYESTKIQFEVTNPYSQDCEFNVIIKNIINNENENENNNKIPSPWHCDKKIIKIKSLKNYNFSMEYLPFDMNNNKHKCSITFMDKKYGEFLYNVIGEPLLPKPIENIQLKCKDTESISHEINFKNNIKNPFLLKAQKIAFDRNKNNNKNNKNIEKLELQSNPCVYDINISSPFYVSPKQLKLDINDMSNANLNISFNPSGPGCYPCIITLTSHYMNDKINNIFNIGDIRIYLIEIIACSQGTHSQLEFNAHANEIVIQKIPIVNSTNNDWRITSEIIGDGINDFNTEKQKEFIIKSQNTNYYNLIYSPKWITKNIQSQLILTNHNTNEKYIYDLNCTSNEPLAIDHIVLECQAKSKLEYEFIIQNPYYGKKNVEYIIESDLPGVCICGDTALIINSSEKSKKYKLLLTPQCGGNVHGTISFIENNNNNNKIYKWYAIELIASSPEPSKIIKISAYLREVVCIEINLSNPISELIEFNVSIIGDGLFGENKLILKPKQTEYIYKLHYSPLITGEIEGSITFSNDISGEFWYKLILIGKKPPSIQLPDMICSIGNICYQKINIENPFNEIINLKQNQHIIIKQNKSNNFYIKNNTQIIINKCSITPIILCYRPSLIGIKQECEIILKHNKLGEWNYNIFGLGKEPNIENNTIIYSLLHSRISKVISFQNPFNQILKITIELEKSQSENNNNKIFQMFIKKKNKTKNNKIIITIAPNESLQIPIFFSPNTMKKYQSNLVICTNNYNERELVWNYPIIGLAQYKSSQLLNIKCNAREIFHKIWNLQLDNYYYINNDENKEEEEEDEFKIEIEKVLNSDSSNSSERYDPNQIIDKSLKVDLIKKKLNENLLQIEVLFEPLRAFNGISKLHIINKQGVRWIFQLNFIVNKSEVDDIIKIESQLHCTTSICFGLNLYENENNNNNNKSIPFRAYFTADSPFEFDVNPKQGNNENGQQQQFIVSFTPNEYGAALNGKLIIETSVMEWSYKVIGTHPTYIPPNLNSFKPTVDNKISKKIQIKRHKQKIIVKKRNFLRKNISATKKQTK